MNMTMTVTGIVEALVPVCYTRYDNSQQCYGLMLGGREGRATSTPVAADTVTRAVCSKDSAWQLSEGTAQIGLSRLGETRAEARRAVSRGCSITRRTPKTELWQHRLFEIREPGDALRNPAPGNHSLVRIVKPSGCHCTDGHLTSRASVRIEKYRRVPTPLRSTSPFSDERCHLCSYIT